MEAKDIRKLLDLISELVNGELVPGYSTHYKVKREVVFAECDANDQANLEEFASWFE